MNYCRIHIRIHQNNNWDPDTNKMTRICSLALGQKINFNNTVLYTIGWRDFFVVDLKEDGTALTKGQAWFCEFPKNYTLVKASPLSVVFLCIWIYLLYTLFRVILNCIELVWINQILRWIKNIMCWMLDSIHRTRIKTEKMQMSLLLYGGHNLQYSIPWRASYCALGRFEK